MNCHICNTDLSQASCSHYGQEAPAKLHTKIFQQQAVVRHESRIVLAVLSWLDDTQEVFVRYVYALSQTDVCDAFFESKEAAQLTKHIQNFCDRAGLKLHSY